MSKQLLCPTCGAVVAEATYTRWPGNLVVVSPDGRRIQPEGAAVQLLRARAADEGAGPGAAAGSSERVEFLRRHLDELVYELRCRDGHAVLRTMPQLVRAVWNAGGRWADLG